MAFAQITGLDSLGDTVACLRTPDKKLYHLGIRGNVSKSTLAKANELRDWRIYEDFAMRLIGLARKLYEGEVWGEKLKQSVYAFDSSTIDLCLTLFPWAAAFRARSPFATSRETISIPCFLSNASTTMAILGCPFSTFASYRKSPPDASVLFEFPNAAVQPSQRKSAFRF
jgi:hypothetical protein